MILSFEILENKKVFDADASEEVISQPSNPPIIIEYDELWPVKLKNPPRIEINLIERIMKDTSINDIDNISHRYRVSIKYYDKTDISSVENYKIQNLKDIFFKNLKDLD